MYQDDYLSLSFGSFACFLALNGNTLGVDATTLEANAALRLILHRRTGESYEEFLKKLAEESGIETVHLGPVDNPPISIGGLSKCLFGQQR